jgi:hypothetical protein
MKILRLKILLPIFLLHVVALPFLLYQYMIHFEEPVWEALGQSVLSELQNRIAVHQLTGTPSVAEVQKAVDEFSNTYQFLSLRVYDASGRLRASHGHIISGPHPYDRATMRVEADGYVLDVTHWVRNAPACHSCHPQDRPVIGAIEASMAVTEVAAKLGAEKKHALEIAFATLILVFGLISTFHYLFIVRPVNRISKALQKIKDGDLSATVPVKRDDELGVIAGNINEMAASLRQARKELEEQHRQRMTRAEQLATVGEIAAGLAHEVKNPLAGISSALEVVVAETDESWPHREVLGQIIEEAHRIAGTINRLLDYTRPKRSEPEWWDLSLIAGDIQNFFAPQCQKHRVAFDVNLNEPSGRMHVDAGELRQVLMNILLNALDAVGPGGWIRLQVEEDRTHVVFSISDNGPGMDEATRERIFQPFFTTKPAGTGLGLAIAMRTAKDMGGTLTVDTRPGAGTTFTIVLPRECYREAAHH